MEAPYSPRRGLDSMKRHQDLYKKTPDWKRKYKDRCRDRLKCGRTRLLEQFRGIQIVDQVMKETASETGILSAREVDSLMELYDEIRKELLEEEALWALEEEPIEEPLENTQPVPCPSCAKPLESHDEAGTTYPKCSTCRIVISVSASTLQECYGEWFAAHIRSGCDWEPDVTVIPTPNQTGQVQISCDGCGQSNIINNLIVKRF